MTITHRDIIRKEFKKKFKLGLYIDDITGYINNGVNETVLTGMIFTPYLYNVIYLPFKFEKYIMDYENIRDHNNS